jgi:hypothetical protein
MNKLSKLDRTDVVKAWARSGVEDFYISFYIRKFDT